jgi:hypothetical protein
MLPESHPLADAEIMLLLLFEHTPPEQYVEFCSIVNKEAPKKYHIDNKVHVEVAQAKDIEKVFDNVLADWITRENRMGRDIYFGVCPRQVVRRTKDGYPMRGGNEQVTHAVCAWMDYDKLNYKAVMTEKPEPTFVVFTGHGAHFYWKYPEAVAFTKAVEDSNRFKVKFGGDDTTDPARLLRVPGTKNWKEPESDLKSRMESVTETIFEGLKEDGSPAANQKQKTIYDLPWDLRNVILSGYSAAVGNYEKKKEDGTTDRSAVDWRVMCTLMEYEYSEDDIRAVFFNKEYGISEKTLGEEAQKGNADHYFQHTYDKARVEFQKKSLLYEEIGDIIEFETWKDIRNAPPLEFVVDRILPIGGMLIVSGPAKSWKSFLTQELILLLSGVPGKFMGMFDIKKPVVDGHCVAYCQSEITKGSLDYRLSVMATTLEADWRTVPIRFLNRSFDLANPKHVFAMINGLQKIKAQFLVIDPLARFHHEDENKQRDMSKVLSNIEAIARQAGVLGTIVLHHHGKPPSEGPEREGVHAMRGSSVIGDWGNGHVILRKKFNKFQGKKFVSVEFELRDAEEPTPISLILNKHTHRLEPYSEDTDNSIIVRDITGKSSSDVDKIKEVSTRFNVSEKAARDVLARAKHTDGNGSAVKAAVVGDNDD